MFISRAVTRILCLLLVAGTASGALPARACACGTGSAPVRPTAPACCDPAVDAVSCCTGQQPGMNGCCCAPAPDDCDCTVCECGTAVPAKAPADSTVPVQPDEFAGTVHAVAPAGFPAAVAVSAAVSSRLADRHRALPPPDLVISLSRLIC